MYNSDFEDLNSLNFFFLCQKCARSRAVKSILCVSDISKDEAEKIVSSVFEDCYKDTEPFDRIPP